MTAPTTNRPDLAILGLGYLGLTLAVEAVRAGLSVAAYDPDQEVVTAVRTGSATGNGVPAEDMEQVHYAGFVATSRVAAVPAADTYAICVPTSVTRDGSPDLSSIARAATVIAQWLEPGCLVMVESTIPPGTTDTAIAPTRMQAHAVNRVPAAPRHTVVDAVDLAALAPGVASHEQTDSPAVAMLNTMTAGYRAHERRVGAEPRLIEHGQRETRDAR